MKISAQRMAPKHGSDTRGCDVSKTIQICVNLSWINLQGLRNFGQNWGRRRYSVYLSLAYWNTRVRSASLRSEPQDCRDSPFAPLQRSRRDAWKTRHRTQSYGSRSLRDSLSDSRLKSLKSLKSLK